MKIAICFLTTNINHFNLILLNEQIKKSKLHNIDLYAYVNDKNKEYEIIDNIVYFKYEYLNQKYNYKYIDTNYIGNTFLAWIDMYNNHKNEYDFYMFYEDDLSYFGKENLFDRIDFDHDFVFQDKRTENDFNWYWIKNKEYKLDCSIIYNGLCNIYGGTSKTIEGLIDYYKQGNYCHHEGLISTYILNNNYNVNYINNYMTIYTDCLNTVPINAKYDLCHPVKTIEKYKQILEKHIISFLGLRK